MAIYYVLEEILQAKHLNDGDTTERLKQANNIYFVESSTCYLKKRIYVFKDYEPAITALNKSIEIENDELSILRQISAWTSRGAAKVCMLGEGIILHHPTMEEVEAKKKDSLIGAVMLHAIENYNIPPEEMRSLQDDIEHILTTKSGTDEEQSH